MADDDHQPNAELEIAHVLFIDIVGYSALLINEQTAAVAELNQIVRHTPHFRSAEAAGKLIRIPTGDGMALVFFNTPEAPVQCALEVGAALRESERIRVRMGINSGPVDSVADVNNRSNVAGAGINIGQRIMDCGDAGHILLSKRVAEDLSQYAHWKSKLRDLGQIEAKHGVMLSVFNLCGEGFGNSEMPSRMRRRRQRFPSRTGRRRRVWIGAVVIALLAIGGFVYRSASLPGRSASSSLASGKSIAVLPFDNFSDDKQNNYFADGIQDDILTALAKISDLKVISRSSVMRYQEKNRNLPQIGRELNVAHLLEGSVRRAGGEIRVSAQLIDARTDAHLWAETYDRKLSDIFAIQSEIAEKIVSQLQATLSPMEKAALNLRPTQDLEAFDLFLQAKQLITNFSDTPDRKETLLKALRLLDEAITRDSRFALAFCWAAIGNDNLYWHHLDHSPARLALAESCVRQALAIVPDLGEAHLAKALVFYHGYRDYAQARQQLAIARRSLPNSAEAYSLTGYIDRREGKWDDGTKNLEKAAELDPRNLKVLGDLEVQYDLLRRYDDKEKLFDRAIAANPATTDYFQLLRGETELEKGNVSQAREVLDKLPPQYDPDGAATVARINLFLYGANPGGALASLEASKQAELMGGTGSLLPRSYYEGQIARAQGDKARMEAAFTTARHEVELKLHNEPDNALLYGLNCVINAGLGHKEEALSQGRRAVELLPVSKDAVDGPVPAAYLAMGNAWLGEIDSAMEQLTTLATHPGGPDYGQLKFDPAWKDVRSDPRFQAMLSQLEPLP